MDSQLIKTLTSLGLNEKEAKVYLACTKNGTSVVSAIAQTGGINRVTTYDILEKLKTKGLVSFYTKNKVKYYSSVDPELLLEEYEKRTDELRRSIPKFKTLTGEINHPRVRYFEGLEGIKNIYSDTLSSTTEILNFSNSHEIRKKWPTYDEDYVQKRAKKKIFLRGIAPKDKAGEIVHAEDEKYQREMRLIDSDKFDFTNEINIYEDKVAIISFRDELIGMIIESPEIANSQRAIFNMCWEFSGIMEQGNAIKGKMLEPIKHEEIAATIESERKKEKAIKPEEKLEKESNLSLF